MGKNLSTSVIECVYQNEFSNLKLTTIFKICNNKKEYKFKVVLFLGLPICLMYNERKHYGYNQ